LGCTFQVNTVTKEIGMSESADARAQLAAAAKATARANCPGAPVKPKKNVAVSSDHTWGVENSSDKQKSFVVITKLETNGKANSNSEPFTVPAKSSQSGKAHLDLVVSYDDPGIYTLIATTEVTGDFTGDASDSCQVTVKN
jgi:hypothetical protein